MFRGCLRSRGTTPCRITRRWWRSCIGRSGNCTWSWTGSKKKLPSLAAERRPWITPGDQRLSITQQCRLLELPRSTYYHAGVGESDENLELMRLIDEQYLRTPFYCSRGMTQWLIRQGHDVNRKRIQRLMRVMGLAAIY